MSTEIWTAKEVKNTEHGEILVFEVTDKETKKFLRIEPYSKQELPEMIVKGGYPLVMGIVLAMQELPWRFQKTANGQIYIEGKSVGADDAYHPIDE